MCFIGNLLQSSSSQILILLDTSYDWACLFQRNKGHSLCTDICIGLALLVVSLVLALAVLRGHGLDSKTSGEENDWQHEVSFSKYFLQNISVSFISSGRTHPSSPNHNSDRVCRLSSPQLSCIEEMGQSGVKNIKCLARVLKELFSNCNDNADLWSSFCHHQPWLDLIMTSHSLREGGMAFIAWVDKHFQKFYIEYKIYKIFIDTRWKTDHDRK